MLISSHQASTTRVDIRSKRRIEPDGTISTISDHDVAHKNAPCLSPPCAADSERIPHLVRRISCTLLPRVGATHTPCQQGSCCTSTLTQLKMMCLHVPASSCLRFTKIYGPLLTKLALSALPQQHVLPSLGLRRQGLLLRA